ncbi:unnamed protein product [Ilex paraguariensis]|uniref:Uncharacterized protein n=1 Tax=Ilex paraguariensis TaxID=185542 RepID=A0ABC8TIQ2_9AQUA
MACRAISSFKAASFHIKIMKQNYTRMLISLPFAFRIGRKARIDRSRVEGDSIRLFLVKCSLGSASAGQGGEAITRGAAGIHLQRAREEEPKPRSRLVDLQKQGHDQEGVLDQLLGE